MADYFKIGLDSPVSAFDICQAHQQLESDYNVGGWLRERPSNARRMESTGVQLLRMHFEPGMRWVDIYPEDYYANPDGGDDDFERSEEHENSEDEDVRDIYIRNVLKWKLPLEESEKRFIRRRYVKDFLQQYPWVFEPGDFPGTKG
jgi:hypothetical protein